MDVSIIIVNFNSGTLLHEGVRSLLDHVSGSFEVLIVDNNSTDHSLAMLPADDRVTVIRLNQNYGFSKACNEGAKKSSGRLLHFLNPDAMVTDNINLAYQDALKAPDAIYVTRIEDTRSMTERSSYSFPTLKNILNILFFPSRVASWHIGASVIAPRPIFNALGGWSEDYFLYCEDLDFFYRAWMKGIPTRNTAALVIHHQGGTTRKVWTEVERLYQVEKSSFIFVKKYRLWVDYFLFRHLAFLKRLFKCPTTALTEIMVYWVTLFSTIRNRFSATN